MSATHRRFGAPALKHLSSRSAGRSAGSPGFVVGGRFRVSEYTDYTYDGLGRPLTSTVHASTFPAAGETTSYTYTPTGQQATVTDPPEANAVTGVTHQIQDSYTYNDDNDVLTETQSDLTGGDPSRTTTYTYNDWDQVATVTQPAGATTGGTPQSDGAASSNPDGATTGYDYDALGNVTQVTDPNGNEYRYTYNEYQEPTQETLYTSSANEADSTATCTAPATQDPDGGCDLVLDSDAYDPAGLLASTTDAAGRITNYAYDNDQELIESSSTQACSASGTEPGPCTSMGTCTPTAQCTSGSVGTLTLYNYDGAGNLVSQAVSATDGGAAGTTTTTNYTYDADDMLTAEVQDATPSTASSSSGYLNRTTAYTYDADGDMLSKTVGTGDALAETGYTYNTSGAMTSQSVTDPGAGGPVAWYPLTQSSGTSVPDSVAGGRPATSDGTTWTGSAASFPGTSGDISTNGPVVDTTGSFSVSAWVNLAGDTSDNQAVMSQSAGTDAGFYLKYNPSTGSWQFTRSQTDSTDPVNSNANDSTAASTGTWTFLTATYDANTGAMTLYVNGTAAGSGTDTTPIASSGPLLIGAGKFDSTLGNFFDGSIADAQVYPYALSTSQVSSLFGLGQGGGDVTTGKLTTTWTPDEQGQPTSMTDPDGNVTDYTYDPAGQLVTQTGAPVGASTYASQTATTTPPVTTYGYDTFGDQTQVEDPDGNVTTTAYDGDGRETSVTQPSYTPPGSSSPITAITSFGYDEDGNLTSVTDPEGNVTSYGYDALGDVTSVTDPLMPGQSSPESWDYTYDADGEQLSATDPLGNKTSETYDYFGNVASSTDAQGNTTRYAYDYLGDQTMADTPDSSVTTSTYDHLGELTSTTDGAGDTTSDTYNDQGNLSEVTNPDGTSVEYGYDQAGRQTSIADYGSAPAGQAAPELRSESFGYDQDGNQTSATDWDGNTTTSLYNPAGELTGQVKPVSASSAITTSYGYDTAGNRTSVTGGDGNTTWTTYNPWNLPESVVEPTTSAAPSTSDTTYTTAYNADGLPSAVTEPGGVALSYGYDPLGDITSESGSGASASTAARSFTYDSDQRMTSATSGSGTDSFTYNGDGDLTGASGPSGTSSYTYNGDALVQSETDAAGTTSYTYDAADRLSTETEPLTGATLTYGYNADSNQVSVSYASGGSTGPEQAFGYNSLQQVTSDTLTSASGSVLASESYGYDADGNVTSQATGGLLTDTSSTYAYDEADQLTSSTSGGTTTSYAYDGDGNLTQDGSTTNTYNAQDQLTSAATPAGTTDYSYTLNGELASVTPPSGSATDYAFDAYGDLASAGSVSYGYDALGRMDSRTVGSGSATSLSYLGTGSTVASDGTDDYSYTPSGSVTAAGTPGGTAFTTMTDQHGDVVGTFSPTSTAEGLAGYSSYSPYGAETATNFGENLGYQGDYTDPVTGLVYMNARWYNPATGSFVSSDTLNGTPIPSTVDGNPYAYADGNPVTDIDPTGHSIWTDVGDDIDVAAHDTLEAGDAAYDGLVSYAEPVGEGLLEGASGVAVGAAVLTTAGFTALFTAASWIFADSTESGCEDVICGQQSYGGGSPAPTWAPEGTPDGGSGGSGGSGPGGSLGNAGTGSYTCTIGCGPISPPQPPPPPPPPPQDCYAGPDPTCTVPPTPGSLLHTPLITSIVKNITSFVELCKQGDCITEHDTSKQGAIKGTTPSGNQNPGNPDDADQNDQQLLQPIKNQGVQPAPEPQPQPAADGAGKGSGDGACVPDTGNKQSLKDLADQVRQGGKHPAAVNMRVIAIGEDSQGQLHAGSSGNFDPGQRAELKKLGIGRVPTIQSYHAEEEILTAVPDLVRIGISTTGQPPCGPEKRDCLGQLTNAGVEIEC